VNNADADTITGNARLAIVTAALSSMLAPLNSTIIVIALPEILRDFGRSLAWGSWIVTSYLVAMATIQPLAGSLGDRYGRRRLMLVGLLLFLAATLAAALAWNIEVLLIARASQAIGGAIAIPNGVALVRATVPPTRQGRANGVIGSGIAVAAGLGPPLGGIVTDALGWRWVFLANLLLIAPALWLLSRLPADRPVGQRRGFDLLGAGLMMVTLVSLVLALTLWRISGVPVVASPVLGVVAVAGGALLWRHLRHTSDPLVNFGLFRAPGYTPAVSAVLLSNLAMYTVLLSLPIFLTRRAGWDTRQTGLLLAGLSLQMIVFSPLGGRLTDLRGARVPAVAGAGLTVLAMLPLLSVSASWTWPLFLAVLIVFGIGMGLSSAPVQASAVLAVSTGLAGQASGLFSTMRYFGSITGTTLMAVILTGDTPTNGQFRLLYVMLAVAAAASVIVSMRLPGPARAARRAARGQPAGQSQAD
jgi:EmrB/QacA subfamily drug resistance transporter